MAEIWEHIKDPKSKQLSKAMLVNMLRATGRVAEEDLEQEASKYIISHTLDLPRRLVSKGMSRRNFFHSLFEAPSLASSNRLRDVRMVPNDNFFQFKNMFISEM
jgi:hypothetical protein